MEMGAALVKLSEQEPAFAQAFQDSLKSLEAGAQKTKEARKIWEAYSAQITPLCSTASEKSFIARMTKNFGLKTLDTDGRGRARSAPVPSAAVTSSPAAVRAAETTNTVVDDDANHDQDKLDEGTEGSSSSNGKRKLDTVTEGRSSKRSKTYAELVAEFELANCQAEDARCAASKLVTNAEAKVAATQDAIAAVQAERRAGVFDSCCAMWQWAVVKGVTPLLPRDD